MPQDFIISGQTLTDIGDAIREKGGAEGGLTPEAMPSAIRSIASVKDVQVAGVSVLKDGVANVPVATADAPGVVSVLPPTDSGILNDNGSLKVSYATDAEISGRTGTRKAIVCANMDYAVKAAMCDGKGAAWTSVEQKAARERMGIGKAYELIEEITLSENTMQINRDAEPDGTAYAFEAIAIKINRTNNGTGSIRVYSGSNELCWSYISETGRYCGCETFLQRGYWQNYRYGATDSDNTYPSIVPNGHSKFLAYKKVTGKFIDRIAITSSVKGFDTGTIISIYGVRA